MISLISHYFLTLGRLGDFQAATYRLGGYISPYIDFAISKIHTNYFYVIGEFRFQNWKKLSVGLKIKKLKNKFIILVIPIFSISTVNFALGTILFD